MCQAIDLEHNFLFFTFLITRALYRFLGTNVQNSYSYFGAVLTINLASILQGHSVARKLNSDGRVDMVQTLHNLNAGMPGG